MNKTKTAPRTSGEPAVIHCDALLVRHPEAAPSETWAALNIPLAVSDQLRGMDRVEGTINGHPFRAALESTADGVRWLRVNKAMREGAGAGIGDAVQLAVLGPEPDPVAPADLQAALSPAHEAAALWESLTDIGRRDWIRWIEAAKKPETRARRIVRTVEQLAEGKRRPCCVNVYEYMLCRVREL
jgi:hypothetical protein